MGEVYRAKDGKLKREVALKLLSDLIDRDAQRMLRLHAKQRSWLR
jgi:hypothetical protein